MKAVLACMVLLACATITSAQMKTSLEEIQYAYKNVAWKDAGEITYAADAKLLTVKNYRIPVTENTRVRTDKNLAHFFLQKGTAVTDIHDPAWRRADFIIPFQDKKSASAFVKYFNKLKEDQ